MEWYPFNVADLSNPKCLAATSAAFGSWVRMLTNCYRLENGGYYEYSSEYYPRQWMSIAGVDREEVDEVVSAGLATWESGGLRIHGYDLAQEEKATKRREKGQKAIAARWGNTPSITTSDTEERKGEEKKGEEKREETDTCPAGGPAGPCGAGEEVANLDLFPEESPEPEAKKADDSFERFWSAWPKRVKRLDASKVWRAKRCDLHLETILAALAWQVKSAKWTADGCQYIPNPDTYLRGKLWEDDPSAYAGKGARDPKKPRDEAPGGRSSRIRPASGTSGTSGQEGRESPAEASWLSQGGPHERRRGPARSAWPRSGRQRTA